MEDKRPLRNVAYSRVENMHVIRHEDLNGTDAEFLTDDAQTLIDEAMEKALVGELDENGWNEAVQTAWETDGKIRSAVWTEQYHAFVGE